MADKKYVPSWLKTDIEKDASDYGWNYEGWRSHLDNDNTASNTDNKISWKDFLEENDNFKKYKADRAAQTEENAKSLYSNMTDYTSPYYASTKQANLTPPPISVKPKSLQAKPNNYGMEGLDQVAAPPKYSLNEWDKLGFFDKAKAILQQHKTGDNSIPFADIQKQEVDKRASSPIGAALTGFENSASLGAFNQGAKKQQEYYNISTPTVFDQAKEQSPISYGVGEFAGYAMPTSAGTKVAKPLTSKIANPLLSKLAEGALVGGGMTATQDAIEQKPIGTIFKDTAINTGLGAGLDLAIGLPKYIKGVNKDILDKAFIDKFGELPNLNELKVKAIDTKFNNILPPKEINPSLSGKFKLKNTQLESAVNNYNSAIDKIHNYFQTDKLTAEEVARIKPELGVDLDKLLNDINKYADGPKLNAATDKAIYNYVTGIKEAPNKLQVPNFKAPTADLTPPILKTNIKPLEISKREVAATNLLQPDLKPRSFPTTVANGEITSPELKRLIEKTDFTYKPLSNNDTLQFAKKAVQNNFDDALSLVKSNAPATAESNAIAQLLINKFQNEGNYTDALDVIQKVSEKATKQGQAIQALSMWGRLTPEGMLKFAQQTVDKANSKLPEGKKIKLSEEIAKDITDRMKQIQSLPEGREKTVATAEVLKKISDQVPPSLLGKISNIQTISQLFNPKTAIRNILGNAGFNMMENVKDVIATPLDIGLSKITGQRTVGLPNLKTQGQGFVKGLKLGYQDAVKGIDTTGIKTQFDLPQQSMFKTKFGKSIEKLVSVELKAPDRAFYQAAYDDSIRKQMKLAKVLEPNDKMIENAHLDALYKTFQDDNAVSKAFSNVKKSLNLYKEFGLGDIVLKYPKTPANILMRAVDYSPAGYAKSVIQLAKDINNRSFNQKSFVESIGRASTGTASLVGTGYILNQLGIITGQSESDKDTKEVEKSIGLGDYKINTSALKRYIFSGFNKDAAKVQNDDAIMDYSFMQPMAIGLVIGADISQNKANPSGNVSKLVDAIMTGTDTLVEQPLLQGIKRLNGQGSTSKAMAETLKGVPASFVPSLLNQVRQLTDNVNRNTYDTSLGTQSLNLVKNKIPGLSKKLEPRVDVLGQEKELFQNKSNNPLNVFLNPTTVTKYQDKPALQLPLDIFKETGQKVQMPTLVDNKITHKGKSINLTPKELTTYQKFVGQNTLDKFNELATKNSSVKLKQLDPNSEKTKYITKEQWFKDYTPEEQAKILQNALDKIKEDAKTKILKDRGIIE